MEFLHHNMAMAIASIALLFASIGVILGITGFYAERTVKTLQIQLGEGADVLVDTETGDIVTEVLRGRRYEIILSDGDEAWYMWIPNQLAPLQPVQIIKGPFNGVQTLGIDASLPAGFFVGDPNGAQQWINVRDIWNSVEKIKNKV